MGPHHPGNPATTLSSRRADAVWHTLPEVEALLVFPTAMMSAALRVPIADPRVHDSWIMRLEEVVGFRSQWPLASMVSKGAGALAL